MANAFERVMPVVAVISLVSCKRHVHPEITAKLVEVTPRAVVVEVKTKPGLDAGFGTFLSEGEGTKTDADGVARIELPIASTAGWDGMELEIVAQKRTMFEEVSAGTNLKLPCVTKSFHRITKANDELWFAVLGSGLASKDAFGLETDDDATPPARLWIDEKEKKLPLVIAAPKDAKVRLGSHAVEADPIGITDANMAPGDLALGAVMEDLEKGSLRLPVVVSKDGHSARFTLALRPTVDSYGSRVAALLASRLARIGEGAPVSRPEGVTAVDAVLLTTTTRRVVHVGAKGVALQARWIAIEQGTRRKAKSCGPYVSISGGASSMIAAQYEDLDVRVVEADTGKEVGKQHFPASSIECPPSAADGDEIVGRPDEDTITAWLEKGIAKNWK